MKKKGLIYSLILILLACTFSVSGCKFFYSSKLKTPKIFANEESKVLYWDANYNASAYEVQMNDVVVGTIESDNNSTQYEFSYAEVIGDFGSFSFRVKCIGSKDYADSDLSEEIVIKVGTASDYLNKNLTTKKYDYDANYEVKNIKVVGDKLKWDAINIPNLSGYLVSIYTNTLGIKHYNTDLNELTIEESMKSGSDILAIRVSSIIGNKNYKTKDLFYYNPVDCDEFGQFTDTIYVFDGMVYDHYIESWAELQNFYYYSFINRFDRVEFKVKDSFYSEYQDSYFDTTMGNAYDYIIYSRNDCDAFYETVPAYSVDLPITLIPIGGYNLHQFRLTFDFEYAEPTIESVGAEPYFKQDMDFTPYYETVNYTKRTDDFDDFVSDDWYLSTYVDNSEELFWAVSSHVTPKFHTQTSIEYQIYMEAKEILRDIISDNMSDYEKALSIFDYLMLNTTYDQNTFDYGRLEENIRDNPMKYMCYYLEGVFTSSQKVAVCDGYSKAFAMLCNMEGINAVRIMGYAGSGGHAWNKVEIDDNWYVVDLTWTEMHDDSSHSAISFNADEEEGAHTFFLVSDKEIETHTDYKNRFIYTLLDADKSYNYYVNDKINFSKSSSQGRIITSIEQLKTILDNALIDDYSGLELVFDVDFYQANGGEIEILIASKPYKFTSIEYYVYETLVGTSFKTLKFFYDNEDAENFGIFIILKPSVSLSTTNRLNEYVQFVKTNKITKSSEVSLTKAKIDEWIGTTYATDEERISALETYFNTLLGSGITINITRLTEDVTEVVRTQDEEDNWVITEVTSADYKFEFTYSE